MKLRKTVLSILEPFHTEENNATESQDVEELDLDDSSLPSFAERVDFASAEEVKEFFSVSSDASLIAMSMVSKDVEAGMSCKSSCAFVCLLCDRTIIL